MPEFDHKSALAKVSEEPGVYCYFDEEGTIIYVGKAKNLKNRISSYFAKSNQYDQKTKRLVSQIQNLEFTIVRMEKTIDCIVARRQKEKAMSWSPKGSNALAVVTAHIANYKSATVDLH